MSEIKVNKITPKTGTSIQLGESGDTITIPCGATLTNNGTATGFGLSFCTTVKTSPFTATANKGFLINTGSAVTVTLPASPSTGDELIIVDQTGQAATNNITIGRNGSKIKGSCSDVSLVTNRGGLRLVYSGSSQGWITATAGNDATASPQFISATGGTETTSGNFKIHTFNSDANFVVSSAPPSAKVSYMVIAGGGSGGNGCTGGGAGGAGGFREGKVSSDPYTASPLAATPCSGLSVSAQTYPITIGGGGAAKSNPNVGASGSNSVFSTITSAGGGGGGKWATGGQTAGGSGGGSAQPGGSGGAGNTPPVSPPQGNNGGGLGFYQMGGGGGATAVGQNGNPAPSPATRTPTEGNGGTGATSSINGTPTERAGGGAGGYADTSSIPQGKATATGGGGTGGGQGSAATAGTANTGGGGGGSGGPNSDASGAGGSGVVIIRYQYQ